VNTDRERYDEQLALLLDCQGHGEAHADAMARMLRDPDFRQEAESLQEFGALFSRMGEELHGALGEVDLVDDVRDSIAHLAMEELAVVNASPFGEIERALSGLRDDFDESVGTVSLVADIMDAVAAAHKTDEEVELPFRRETEDLRALGEEIAAHSPQVNLVQPVAAEMSERYVVPMVPLRARPATASTVRVPASQKSWPGAVGWAAAAALCAAGSWFAYQYVMQDGVENVQVARSSTDVPESKLPAVMEPVSPATPALVSGQESGASTPEPSPQRTSVRPPEDTPLSLQEVINARRADLVNDTRAIAALSTMTKEEAIALLKEMDLSVEALIGATQFLSPEEAIAVLRAAVAENPDDPHLRYALAQSLGENPETLDERMSQLNQLAMKDTANGLPHYMLASDYLARGETDLALDALTRGSAFAEASAYTLEAARQREAAYLASGYDPDVARLLALSTSGETEYSDIAGLRNELMDYGAYYEELGDIETAQQIYNAVSELGAQLARGADMAVERQYGLETQQEAVLAITTMLQDPQVTALIGDTLSFLATSLVEVGQYIQASQELVINPSLSEQIDWTAYLEHVIRYGDLDISDFLQ